jgi:hypothetical protein
LNATLTLIFWLLQGMAVLLDTGKLTISKLDSLEDSLGAQREIDLRLVERQKLLILPNID